MDDKDNLNKNIIILKTEFLNEEMVKLGYRDFNYHVGKNTVSHEKYLSYLNTYYITLINEFFKLSKSNIFIPSLNTISIFHPKSLSF
jgi:hypothetical protein